MPLDLDEFEKLKRDTVTMRLGRNQMKVAMFLKENGTSAFTQREIKKATNIKFDAAVNTALHSLKVKRLIRRKEIEGMVYWRGTDGLSKVNPEDKESPNAEETDEQNGDEQDSSEGAESNSTGGSEVNE